VHGVACCDTLYKPVLEADKLAIVEPLERWDKNNTVTEPVQEPPTLNELDGWAAADAGSLGVTSGDIENSYTPDSSQVTSAQRQLNALGLNASTEDGLTGPATDAAVRSFQQANGLEVTGRLDAATTSALAPESTFNPLTQNPSTTTPRAATPLPASYGSSSWAASLSDAEVQQKIDTWSGSDNDPILDTLVRERNSRLPEPEAGWESFDDYQEAVDTFETEGIEQQVWAAADSGSLDPLIAKEATPPVYGSSGWAKTLSDAEIQRQITGWSGSDNDPILDRLVGERNSRLPEPDTGWDSFSDYQDALNTFAADAINPEVWAAADSGSLGDPISTARGIRYSQQEFSGMLYEASVLDDQISNWSGSDNDPIFDQYVRERNALLEDIAGADEELGRILIDLVNDGTPAQDAIIEAAAVRYEDASMEELLQQLQWRTTPGANFDPFAYGLSAELAQRAETFTGADAGTINIQVAAWAESQGISYNEAAAVFNSQSFPDDGTGPQLIAYMDDPVASGDEAANRLIANPDLFVEMETARQGNTDSYDGKMSMQDIDAILADPENFSDEAVALARFFKDNPDEWATFDTAKSGSALTGLTEGELGSVDGDNTTSFTDIQQRATNGQLFRTLSEAQELNVLIDDDGDGVYSEDEFKAALDRLDQVNPELRETLDTALNYALDQGMDGEADTRAWYTKLQDGAWEIASLSAPPLTAWRVATDPKGLMNDYKSFGLGAFDAVVGMGQMAYDVSAMMPGTGAYAFEHWRVDGDMERHRGMQMAQALPHMADAVASLDPTKPQFYEAIETYRRTGSIESHAGINLIKTTADWETFVDDPSRWAGQFAPDVIIEVLTGGGAIVTRGGSTASKMAAASRHAMTELGENGLEAAMRNSLRHGPDLELPPAPKIGDELLPGPGNPSLLPDDKIGSLAAAGDQTPPAGGADEIIPVQSGDELASVGASSQSDNAAVVAADETPGVTDAGTTDSRARPDGVSADDELVAVGANSATDDLAQATVGDGLPGGAQKADSGGATDSSSGPETQVGDQGGSGGDVPPSNTAPGGSAGDDLPDFDKLDEIQAGDTPAFLSGTVSEFAQKNQLGRVVQTFENGDGFIHIVEDGVTGKRSTLFETAEGSISRGPELPDEIRVRTDTDFTHEIPKEAMPLDSGADEFARLHGVDGVEARDAAHRLKQGDRTSEFGAADDYRLDPDTGNIYAPDGEQVGNMFDQLGIDRPSGAVDGSVTRSSMDNAGVANETNIPFSETLPALNAGPNTTISLDQLRDMPYSNPAERSARNQAAEQYIRELYGTDQGELRFLLDGGPGTAFKTERRVDVPVFQEGGDALLLEVKNYAAGKVPLSSDIRAQVDADSLLLQSAHPQNRPMWIFTDNPPSDRLIAYLEARNVPWIKYN